MLGKVANCQVGVSLTYGRKKSLGLTPRTCLLLHLGTILSTPPLSEADRRSSRAAEGCGIGFAGGGTGWEHLKCCRASRGWPGVIAQAGPGSSVVDHRETSKINRVKSA
ncbi:MAG: hypothetical protein BZ151_11180 [Desulfobacca sp. 4484_104]|nr:MAG: hypothetical protein BZ151_11180 [Desulfobacca sp. 4484_104]